MTSYILIALVLFVTVGLFYIVCSLMHSEIKANASQYSDFKTHTKSNLLFSMESDFAIEKLSKGYPNCSEDKLRMEYEYWH